MARTLPLPPRFDQPPDAAAATRSLQISAGSFIVGRRRGRDNALAVPVMPKVSEAVRPRVAVPLDRELVVAARAGKRWAAEALYRRHRKMVYRLASRFAEAHDREDLIQDSFLKVLCNLDQLKTPELFASWLAQVVVRTAARGFQRKRLSARLERTGPLLLEQLISRPAPPDVFAELRMVYRYLDSLPIEARMAFILRRVERMSVDEVAARLGRSVATVKRRLADADGLLDRRLGARGGDGARLRDNVRR
jgi:RNA polymerase sigma-70 factor (ECF subfamily)